MKFDESEFKKMRYNIRKIAGDEEVIYKFPDLMTYKSVFLANDMGQLDPDFVLRYLIYMYDLGSPARNIVDLKKRKAYVMQLLDVNLETCDKNVVEMLRWKNKGVNRRAVFFLLLIGGPKYMVWQRELEKLVQVATLNIGLDEESLDDKKKAAETEKLYGVIMKETLDSLERAKNDFLEGEKSKELEDELTAFTLSDTLGLRPEEYVRDFEQEGDVFKGIEP
jgi:hypothetical protein